MKGRSTVYLYKEEIEAQIRRRLDEYGDKLRVADVAYVLGVATECARRRVVTGLIKSVIIGRTCYIAKEWIIDFLNEGHFVRERGHEFLTKRDRIVEYCLVPRSRQEIQDYCGFSTVKYTRKVLTKLIAEGRLAYTEKPHHRDQKYIAVRS